METTLKFDKVVLIKELDEKIKKVGEVFEIANVLDDSFLLRDNKTKTALGVVSFEDFEKCFVHEENFEGWTPWMQFVGYNGQMDCLYRTNRKKVQVKFLTEKVRAESCCHEKDDFSLSFGLQLAYLRCLTKAMCETVHAYQEKMCKIEEEILDNIAMEKKMVNSLMN